MQRKKTSLVPSPTELPVYFSKKDATKLLKDAEWNVERALDAFYSNGSLFDTYKDSDDMIGPEGTEKLCGDLGVDPSDVVTIALSWRMKVRKGYHPFSNSM